MKRRIEWTLALDASEIAWSGALDGATDLTAWPWSDFEARSCELWEGWHTPEALRVQEFVLVTRNERSAFVKVVFSVLETHRPDWGVGPTREEHFSLDGIPQPLGGLRWWFRCPTCDARRAKLYKPQHAWMCRKCAGLTYTSSARYSSRTQSSRGWAAVGQWMDYDHARWEQRSRASLRRRLRRGIAWSGANDSSAYGAGAGVSVSK
jgi:hypothetical protein